MQKYFDVFIQPELDKMRVTLSGTGNPASLADDDELLAEYHQRLARSESFRLRVNCHEDYLIGKQSLREQLDQVPF